MEMNFKFVLLTIPRQVFVCARFSVGSNNTFSYVIEIGRLRSWCSYIPITYWIQLNVTLKTFLSFKFSCLFGLLLLYHRRKLDEIEKFIFTVAICWISIWVFFFLSTSAWIFNFSIIITRKKVFTRRKINILFLRTRLESPCSDSYQLPNKSVMT